MAKRRKILIIIAILVAIPVLFLGYGRFVVKDAGGLTKHEALSFSTKEQYELLGHRLQEMWFRVEEVQLALDPGEWENLGIGEIRAGNAAPFDHLQGAKGSNSYYIKSAKAHSPIGADGSVEDLEPFKAWVVDQGWSYEVVTYEGGDGKHVLFADTGDRWVLSYEVRPSGTYYVDIWSGVYWGDRREIQQERLAREFDRGPEYSVPGIHPEFPSWDAPRSERKSLSE